MIRLPDKSLPKGVDSQLKKWQKQINDLPDYSQRVAEAKRTWKNRNRNDSKIFSTVRECLDALCSGPRRCCYCEDSLANEIDHIRPKAFYPEVTYEWLNLLPSCGSCNGEKNDQTAIIINGVVHSVSRSNHSPIAPPPDGQYVLIDPRRENPLDFIRLDLLGTFRFRPIAERGTEEFLRSEYTIKVLKLNERDPLPKARRRAYEDYRARLEEYVAKKKRGVSEDQLQLMVDALKDKGQPTVWAEMKRQHRLIPELERLFAEVPEALDW